ncbi:MAG: ATP-binding protein [Aliishimia sp.]
MTQAWHQSSASVGPSTPDDADYWPQTQHIKNADIGYLSELLVRYIIILGAGITLFYTTNSSFYLVWLIAYFSTNSLYCIALLCTNAPVSRRWYGTLFAMNVVTSATYAFMPIYLWTTSNDPTLQAVSLCGIIGHGMFNLAKHTRRTLVSHWNMFIVEISAVAVIATIISQTAFLPAQIAIGFCGLAVMAYYALAQFSMMNDREALADSHVQKLEDLKISAMGQITAGVAHDFNNKLTVIQGNIDLSTLTHDPAERAERLADARAATEQAAEVVAHMRAFVRKSPVSLQTVSLSSVGATLSQSMEPYLPENISFLIRNDAADTEIEIDPDLLQTALLNLALNARDAMAQSGGQLELRFSNANITNWLGRPPAGTGPFVRIDVCDSGPGLPAEQFGIVQEPFFSTKPAGMGTGLGLSMVKGFTEQMGGSLLLQNRHVGGLEVSILLPRNAARGANT